MEAEETDPYVKALLEKDRAQYSKKGSIVLVTTDQGAAFLEAGNHAARITFQTVGSPMKLPRYGQNLGMDEKALQEFGTAPWTASNSVMERAFQMGILSLTVTGAQ